MYNFQEKKNANIWYYLYYCCNKSSFDLLMCNATVFKRIQLTLAHGTELRLSG
jgi:hypothetical protein